MKLKVRYEKNVQAIDLDEATTQDLWVSLSLEDEGFTQDEKEHLIQEEWEKQFNRPDYNSWHKFDRHRGYSKARTSDDEYDVDISESLMSEVADARIFRKDEINRESNEEYEAICRWVREVLVKKPEWADAFIAVYLNDESIRHYAARIGANENNITQKLKRAKKKLQENFRNRQI